MFTQQAPVPTPIAQDRVEILLSKIYSVASISLAIEMLSNALAQRALLNSFWFILSLSLLALSQVGAVFGAFIFGNMKLWYRSIFFVTLAILISWPLQIESVARLPEDFRPWIWWAVGFASLSAVGAFKRLLGLFALLVMPVTWVLVRTSVWGGSGSLVNAIEDSLYALFFSCAVSILVLLLRERAQEVDDEYAAYFQSRFERAFLEVVQRERTKINSIVHDRVVRALDRAADATTEEQRGEAAAVAIDSIGRLEREAARDPLSLQTVAASSLFDAINAAAVQNDEITRVKIGSRQDVEVPIEIAIGIAEATFQALANSREHAANASRREVLLSSTNSALKVVVVDNGPGFRMARVPRSRLGLRVSVFDRLRALGVEANLKSAPGEGTTWVFEWRAA
jgi:signal transduction histidine kinase